MICYCYSWIEIYSIENVLSLGICFQEVGLIKFSQSSREYL